MKYKINEVFASIQGEGLLVGLPMNFVRFCRCNLSCRWCDTEFAEGSLMSAAEIIKKLDRDVKWVALTGGEPMMEQGLLPLISELRKKGFKVLLETNGTLFDKKVFDSCDYVSLDLKGPSSGNPGYSREALVYCMRNLEKSQVKVVVSDRKDLSFFEEIYNKEKGGKYPNWILQPEYKSIDKLDYCEVIDKFPGVRVIPQLHKFMGVR